VKNVGCVCRCTRVWGLIGELLEFNCIWFTLKRDADVTVAGVTV